MSIAIKAAAFEWAWGMIPPIFLRKKYIILYFEKIK